MLKLHCDVCGTSHKVESKSFCYDRKMDAAGSMDDVCEIFDLCESCENKILNKLIATWEKIKDYKHEINKFIINEIKDKKDLLNNTVKTCEYSIRFSVDDPNTVFHRRDEKCQK